ncbi:ClbS/DfsB family four-helix bundle protein [Achromobacter xylosoxidans]|uniref:ClbS/DfsB family four-helix bundle protein n=1 Tax=Alcaligenes xylosoxydans xylosoxydans TaxID=85698 RepID=UPI000B490C3A|nr:ClbS/DfsB family four-helix bundle protein [Achromobacter xylosoxidans]
MKLPASRQELLRNICDRHRQFRIEAATIRASLYRKTAEVGHARRLHTDAATVLIDVMLWNTMILQLAAAGTRGAGAPYYSREAVLDRVGRLARPFRRDFTACTLHNLHELTRLGQERVVGCVARHSDAALFAPSGERAETLGGQLQIFTGMAYANALSKLRAWKQAV